MPIVSDSTYAAEFPYRNGHINTIVPNIFRRTNSINYRRERINTPDDDFLDLDFIKSGSNKILIGIHGLEGSSKSNYVRGLAGLALAQGWDVLALNLRGCSEDPNNKLYSYHSGKSEDLQSVIQYLDETYDYDEIFMVGISLGGNLLLKFLGECGAHLPKKIKSAGAISVPCHLQSSSIKLDTFQNSLYRYWFLSPMRKKAIDKKNRFPHAPFDKKEIRKANTFQKFDDLVTAPVNGFRDAEEYWDVNSSIHFLKHIEIPVLLINACDDPFLSPECFPIQIAKKSTHLFLETPKYGGHVGFVAEARLSGPSWSEQRVFEFLSSKASD